MQFGSYCKQAWSAWSILMKSNWNFSSTDHTHTRTHLSSCLWLSCFRQTKLSLCLIVLFRFGQFLYIFLIGVELNCCENPAVVVKQKCQSEIPTCQTPCKRRERATLARSKIYFLIFLFAEKLQFEVMYNVRKMTQPYQLVLRTSEVKNDPVEVTIDRGENNDKDSCRIDVFVNNIVLTTFLRPRKELPACQGAFLLPVLCPLHQVVGRRKENCP